MKRPAVSLVRALCAGRVDLAPDPVDAAVVLGCKLRPDGTPGRAMAERIGAARELCIGGVAPLIVLSGGRRWHGRVEAEVMAEQLERAGLPASILLLEARSRTTTENALCSASLLREAGASTVLVVTQPFHLPRALRAFLEAGVEARGLIIEESYQLSRATLGWATRDLLRELGATAVEHARRRRHARTQA